VRQWIKTYQKRNAFHVRKLSFDVPEEWGVDWKRIAKMPLLRDIPIGKMDG
jgi:hypothetical protein